MDEAGGFMWPENQWLSVSTFYPLHADTIRRGETHNIDRHRGASTGRGEAGGFILPEDTEFFTERAASQTKEHKR